MDDFLLDCCFNAINESLKFSKLTPRYANRLHAMPHRAESRLFTMRDSTELKKKIYRQLRAMQLNVKFNSKFSGRLHAMRHSMESTLCHAAQCGVSTLSYAA
jgi:hypothetical protein